MSGHELDRLRGAEPPDRPERGVVVTIRARHPDPEQALGRMRELLLAVLPPLEAGDPGAAEAAVPEWFARRCRPVAGWLFWQEPDERPWWWWDGRADGPEHLVVRVRAADQPFANESLHWMLRAVGCREIDENGRRVSRP